MTMGELLSEITKIIEVDTSDVTAQHDVDIHVERLVNELRLKLANCTDDEKNEQIIPFLKDLHSKRIRVPLLKALEEYSTVEINNNLFHEALLENDVSGVIAYLRVFSESKDKKNIKDMASDIYLSGKTKHDTKEFNNLCTMLFYMGPRHDVITKMEDDIKTLGNSSRNLLSGIIDKYK